MVRRCIFQISGLRKIGLGRNRDVKVLPLGEPIDILPAPEQGVIQAGILTTPARLVVRKSGFRELVDSDHLGIQYSYVALSTLRSTVRKNIVKAVEDQGIVGRLYK